MGKIGCRVLAALVLLLLTAGCGAAAVGEEPPVAASRQEQVEQEAPVEELPPLQEEEPQGPTDYDAYVNALFRERVKDLDNQEWLGLSSQEMLEDWDYFYSVLTENYPFSGVVLRTTGMDMQGEYERIREEIPGYSNTEYFLALFDYIQQTGNAGHFSLSWPEGVREETQAYQTLVPLYDQVLQEYWEQSEQELGAKNLTTEILEPGRIGYIKIRALEVDYQEDGAELLEFYQLVQGYDHLIIDITGNGGGSQGYYMDYIFAPLLDKSRIYLTCWFTLDGQLNREHLERQGKNMEDWAPLSTPPTEMEETLWEALEELLDEEEIEALMERYDALEWPPVNMNPDDWSSLDRYQLRWQGSLAGLDTDGEEVPRTPFEGSIWLLVDGDVYSSSESFAVACRETSFATLVGTQTGGDGIGMLPVFFTLPRSGLHIRYAPVYGTGVDGRNNEEFGTTPDIVSPPGESPLETCLQVIREG